MAGEAAVAQCLPGINISTEPGRSDEQEGGGGFKSEIGNRAGKHFHWKYTFVATENFKLTATKQSGIFAQNDFFTI